MRNDLVFAKRTCPKGRPECRNFLITGNAILEALEMMSFVPLRQVTQMIFAPCNRLSPLHAIGSLHSEAIAFGSSQTSDLQKPTRILLSKELLKFFDSLRHHSWKDMMTLDEARLYPSIFLLIMNQFHSAQKRRLHKRREKFRHGRK
jgi:hypothetical protein